MRFRLKLFLDHKKGELPVGRRKSATEIDQFCSVFEAIDRGRQTVTKDDAIQLWFAMERELEEPPLVLTEKLLRQAVARLYEILRVQRALT
jgi:hypothetical protein